MTMLPTYFPSPPRGVWYLGPVPIRAYALFIIAGIVVGLVIGDRRWEARGGERGVIYDIALWAVPFGLIGGRLYHLATDWRTYFGPSGAGLAAALRIWDGGLGIWGAVALGGVGAWIACRRRGIPLPAFGDAIAPGIILAQAIGRLGNYFNQELYGRETTLPWGLEIFYRRDPAGYIDPHSLDGVSTGQLALVVQPTFLYELIWNVLVFVALIYLDRRFTLGHGRLFAIYVAGYCIGRFGVELLRDDTATHIAGIRINSFTSTFVFIGAVVYLVLAPKGREDPASLRGTADVVGEPLPEGEPERKPEPERVTGVSVMGAAAVAGVMAAGKTAKRLIPRRRSKPAEVAEPEVVEAAAEEPETVVAAVAEPEAEEAETAEAEAGETEEPEAEKAEAEPAEPEAEEAEAEAEPAEAEAEEAEGEAEEPEAEEAEVEEPEADEEAEAKEEAEAEEDAEAEGREAEVAEVEAEEAEVEEPEAEEVEEPEAEEPEVAEADADESETAEPEVAQAEEAVAEGEEAEASGPDAAEADAVVTEAEEAEAEELEPESETAEPKVEEPQAESSAESDIAEEAAQPKAAEETPDDTTTPATGGAIRRRLSFRLRGRRGR
ncbi:prolipoprotein diacylglyceryl transferase [Mycobacterium sp. 663a-19]|uniref:prolipoprotein diacylglyceryl transferase n=1 Tax=Mycobacterium sp. 663a-19 TaxID=2986148 RepID=UPI002D1F97A0|nr:prolipoprotein diacylglyceryl transferase [Mycobacterium sp. 663a-19]MEB3981912.1 prolipoprotein diacylglyceryl transferase [Mycobacterium sp. 663a-19]